MRRSPNALATLSLAAARRRPNVFVRFAVFEFAGIEQFYAPDPT